MAATYDNATSNEGNSTSPNASFTIAGASRLLIVGLVANSDPPITLATSDGLPLTELAVVGSMHMFYLIAPNAGVNPVLFTLGSAVDWVVGAVSVNGAAQIAPVPQTHTNTESAFIQRTVETTFDGLVVDCALMINDTMAAAAGQTERVSRDSFMGVFASFGMSTKPGTGGTVNMQWDATATFGDNGIIVVPILAGAAAMGASLSWLRA